MIQPYTPRLTWAEWIALTDEQRAALMSILGIDDFDDTPAVG